MYKVSNHSIAIVSIETTNWTIALRTDKFLQLGQGVCTSRALFRLDGQAWANTPDDLRYRQALGSRAMKLDATRVAWKLAAHESRGFSGSDRNDSSAITKRAGLTKLNATNLKDPPVKAAHSLLRRYGTAIVLVGLAFALTFILRYFFPYPVLFLFFAAVMVSAWLGGTGAGLFAVLLSTLVTDYYFVPPFNSFVIDARSISYFGAFVVCALVASWVSASKRKTEEALREARDQLEIRVAERTAALEKSNADLRRTMRDHEEGQQTLRQSQAELAHLARALTMGELTSSIAHEMNQPLTAVVSHGHACFEWLSADPPDIARARQTVTSIIRDGTRAGQVLKRIRALFSKQTHPGDMVEMNEVILELMVFLRDEALRHQIELSADLAPTLAPAKGDRIQLQQVVLNLMMNALDAIQMGTGEAKRIVVRTSLNAAEGIRISVEDTGIGLSAESAARIFDPFFTTKPDGIGMGLSISRSIVESHRGRLWADPRAGGGSIFQFTLPLHHEAEK